MRTRLALTLAAALALVLVPTAAASRADNPVLVADVGAGDGFGISLTDAAGAKVTHLDPGTYTILVHDRSAIHNFRLTGPGVAKATGVKFKGTASWQVTLASGTYTFRSDKHAKLRGTVSVLAASSASDGGGGIYPRS